MEILIDFPGGSRVDAHFGKFAIATDQPPFASNAVCPQMESKSYSAFIPVR